MGEFPPVNFVLPPHPKYTVAELQTADVDRQWQLFTQGVYVWGLQTYLVLRQRARIPVTLSTELIAGRINFVHGAYLAKLKESADAFVVAIQADYPRVYWADYHVVQNQTQTGRRAVWLPHWPQPGLIPRDPTRRGVRTVGFAGIGRYRPGGRRAWEERLAELGCQLITLGPERWNDMSNIDVMLGIRKFGRYRFNEKPPTKLLNAWFAGTPLVGGFDSAFEQVGSPGEDYLRVSSMDEGVVAIERLKNDPELYERIVAKGQKRCRAYTRGRIAEVWERVVVEHAVPAFYRWRGRGCVGHAEWYSRVLVNRIWTATRRSVRRVVRRGR